MERAHAARANEDACVRVLTSCFHGPVANPPQPTSGPRTTGWGTPALEDWPNLQGRPEQCMKWEIYSVSGCCSITIDYTLVFQKTSLSFELAYTLKSFKII